MVKRRGTIRIPELKAAGLIMNRIRKNPYSQRPSTRYKTWASYFRSPLFIKFSLSCLLITILGSCMPAHTTTRTGTFNVRALETDLRRGISTTADVERVLGKPNGTGGILIPRDPEPRLAWYYERVQMDIAGKNIDIAQDVVLVYFKGDRFDGFMWFSAGVGSE
jgi:hypothetical protein